MISDEQMVSLLQMEPAALEQSTLNHFHVDYSKIVASGYEENPLSVQPSGKKRRGRPAQSKSRNLLDRFRDHEDRVLAFMHDFSVPFDNNLPERDLRMMKLRQKISGTFRSLDAMEAFCRIRSYISTARKNGVNAFEAVLRAINGDPYMLPEMSGSG